MMRSTSLVTTWLLRRGTGGLAYAAAGRVGASGYGHQRHQHQQAGTPAFASLGVVGGLAVTAAAASECAGGDDPQQALRDMWEQRESEHDWLEPVLGEEAMEWVRGQNEQSLRVLGDPKASPLYDRVLQILTSKDKIPHLTKHGDLMYNFWQDAANQRGLWRRTTLDSYRTGNPVWETVLDVDALGKAEGESWVFKGVNVFRDSPRALVYLSRGGADATVVREFNLASKAFVPPASGGFFIPEAKTRVAWKDQDTLLVGTDLGEGTMTDSGYPRTVREWRRGSSLEESPVDYQGEASDVSVSGSVGRHRGTAVEWRSRAVGFYDSKRKFRLVDFDDTRTPLSEWCDLDGVVPDDASVFQFADQMLLQLRSEWLGHAAGTLMALPIAHLMSASGRSGALTSDSFTVLFSPTPTASLEGVSATRNYLLTQTLEHVKTRVSFWRYADGKWRLEDQQAEPAIQGCSIRPVDREESDQFFFTTSSFTQPSTLSLADAAQGTRGLASAEFLRALPEMFDATGLAVTQSFAKSKDGTEVPYFTIRRPNAPPGATLLYGYGGFEISLTPSYASTVGAGWLENTNNTYVLANIRGGGEYGPEWHRAALKENRNKAYEDFVAVAEDLVARGITTPSQLGIRGGSNGGLLMGNMMVLRPDLFGAVCCAVPLLDMKRYNRLLAGASWMAEYGNPDTDEWSFLQKYSAYHNIDPSTKYPALLMTTSTRDDRVHPFHARAFVKRLQDCGNTPQLHYYENIEGGHGGAADASQQAFMTALYLEFLNSTIGRVSGK